MTMARYAVSFALILYSTTLLVHGLTNDELAKFRTTGIAESNTNQIGWVSVATEGDLHIFTSNVIPDHQTGSFPNQDNPHSIIEQDFQISVPVTPTEAETPGCLPMGPIGISVNGIPIFNLFNARGEDATEVEVFHVCNGHPDPTGRYHYHDLPTCLLDRSNDESELIGVAIDGYPIYGPTDENGNNLTSADIDVCSGRYVDGFYQYHFTEHYPYSIGCLKGVPAQTNFMGQCYFACNKIGTDRDSDLSFCDSQTDGSQMPGGQVPDGNNPGGQMPSGGNPGGQTPTSGRRPDGQTPSSGRPSGQMPSGSSPDGQIPSGNRPDGQTPRVGRPRGSSGQIPNGGHPESQAPSVGGQDGQMPSLSRNDGRMQVSSGYFPSRLPSSYFPGAKLPITDYQARQMPSNALSDRQLQTLSNKYYQNNLMPDGGYTGRQGADGYYNDMVDGYYQGNQIASGYPEGRQTFDGDNIGNEMQSGQYWDAFNQKPEFDETPSRQFGPHGPTQNLNTGRRFKRSMLRRVLLGS
ncbi:uncharacterized protein [Ptychodera flava]|uniref:uncharacterized protein n=1 Tax=Ptychodera flava TaxID=63121 RepID=UPI00396A5BB1